MKTKGARKFDRLSYLEVLSKNLKVMDAAAISLCRDNNLPIIVFNITVRGNIKKAVLGEKIGTIVEEKITHSAGAETGQSVSREELLELIRATGRMPVERDTLYNIIRPRDQNRRAVHLET